MQRANLQWTVCIMKTFTWLLSAFMKKIVRLCLDHKREMWNLECAFSVAIHIHDRQGKSCRSPPGCLFDVDVMWDFGRFPAFRICNGKWYSWPIGNKESISQLNGTRSLYTTSKNKNFFIIWNVIFWMALTIHYHIHDRSVIFKWVLH